MLWIKDNSKLAGFSLDLKELIVSESFPHTSYTRYKFWSDWVILGVKTEASNFSSDALSVACDSYNPVQYVAWKVFQEKKNEKQK